MVGWADRTWYGNNAPLISLYVSMIALTALRWASRRYWYSWGAHITRKFIAILCLVTIPLCVICFYRAGKSNLFPPTPGIHIQNWGLSSQGTVLARDMIPGLVEEIERNSPLPPDKAIFYYSRNNKFLRFVLNPIQLQHLGNILYMVLYVVS
jgi:hypothetical protein